ncbi:MAG: SRPBCC family protein [Ardenticatenaceae bacterium]|nr:SRPBCC family protein [Ardenticatenaceae bacterium]
MKLEVIGETIIEAPAAKVWRIIAHEFAHIGRWATSIPQSQEVTSDDPENQGEVTGRVCATNVPGFSDITERFTYYDEEKMRYGYEAVNGNPWFVNKAENNWSVKPLSPSISQVEFRGVVELKPFPGFLMAPFMRLQFKKVGREVSEELKYYVEQGEPHPRKQKQLDKG